MSAETKWNSINAWKHFRAFIALVSLGLFPKMVAAGDVEWTVYAGQWDISKSNPTSELGFEAQRPFRDTRFNLMGGLATTADEAVWGYAGASWNSRSQGKFRLRPGFAVSVFEDGDGKDLGGPIEFRSSLEASYRVRENLRLGLLVYHLSNAGFYDHNPGSNSLVFVVGSP